MHFLFSYSKLVKLSCSLSMELNRKYRRVKMQTRNGENTTSNCCRRVDIPAVLSDSLLASSSLRVVLSDKNECVVQRFSVQYILLLDFDSLSRTQFLLTLSSLVNPKSLHFFLLSWQIYSEYSMIWYSSKSFRTIHRMDRIFALLAIFEFSFEFLPFALVVGYCEKLKIQLMESISHPTTWKIPLFEYSNIC